jgi:hypothetical protein
MALPVHNERNACCTQHLHTALMWDPILIPAHFGQAMEDLRIDVSAQGEETASSAQCAGSSCDLVACTGSTKTNPEAKDITWKAARKRPSESPVRKIRTPGSERRLLGNWQSYRNGESCSPSSRQLREWTLPSSPCSSMPCTGRLKGSCA